MHLKTNLHLNRYVGGICAKESYKNSGFTSCMCFDHMHIDSEAVVVWTERVSMQIMWMQFL